MIPEAGACGKQRKTLLFALEQRGKVPDIRKELRITPEENGSGIPVEIMVK